MIHYKGESTRKSSLNYVRLFYGAMLIFARKHFAGKNERLLSLVILPGVYLRAVIAMISNKLYSLVHSSFWSFISVTFNKILPSFLKIKWTGKAQEKLQVVLIIANHNEATLIEELVKQTTPVEVLAVDIRVNHKDMGYIYSFETLEGIDLFQDITEKIKQIHPDEIIFSAKELTTDDIIILMCQLGKYAIPYRIAHTDIHTIIGSNFVRTLQTSNVSA
jgi:hypothetical protein